VPERVTHPVAAVVVELGLPHLDRPFDYLVPPEMADDAVPGARVSVRFAGRVVNGYVLERRATSEHSGTLASLRRVISSEPVLAPQIAEVARQVADRYAGSMADVLRLAVPPRHARAEQATRRPDASAEPPAPVDPGEWSGYTYGTSLVSAVQRGHPARAVCTVKPGEDWATLLARLVVNAVAGNQGALVVVPDSRDIDLLDAAIRRLMGGAHHVVLQAELGPEARYRRWLAVRRGAVRAVIGTRASAFAPVLQPGLLAIWDDGDDLHAEPRSPYPHAREILLLRSRIEDTAVVLAGYARTAEAQQLIRTGWAQPVEAPSADRRAAAPVVRTVGDESELTRDPAARAARLPSLAWRTARAGLRRGPVLVQVPRAGHTPLTVCAHCRSPATCGHCQGPLERAGSPARFRCRWCGKPPESWRCPTCGDARVRAAVIGAQRTAEELGRALPGHPVVSSGAGHVRAQVPAEPAVVVATPGAEPSAVGGYAAALLLDGDQLLARPGLRSQEEAVRRWFAALALVRPGSAGGEAVVVADPGAPAVQAVVRWDPAGFAERELDQRGTAHLPPAARCVEVSGVPADVAELVELLQLPHQTEVLGPVEVEPGEPGDPPRVQTILRAPRGVGNALTGAVSAAKGVRSARRSGGTVRVRVDPVDLG